MDLNKKLTLPWCPTKSQVYQMFIKINRKTIKEEIIEIMAKHRKKNPDQIKRKKTLFHPEFVQIVKLFGIPNGYNVPDGFFEEAR